MMSTDFPELRALKVSVSDETSAQQWATIVEALETAPEEQRSFRRRAAVWLAAAFAVGLPATAVAAESSIPGDVLYPVKLVVEPLRAIFDADVKAVHRVEEVERLSERRLEPETVDQLLERTRTELARVDRDDLDSRFDRAVGALLNQADTNPTGENDRDGQNQDLQPRTEDDPERAGRDTTTTTVTDRPPTRTTGPGGEGSSDPPDARPPRDNDGSRGGDQPPSDRP